MTLLILLLFGFIQIQWGEKIPINDGLGWDGTVYADATQGFPKNLLRKEFSAYDLQRLFPSAVVNLGMRALGLERSTKNIIKAFQVYNLALLLVSAAIWSSITRDLRIGGRSKWLGFCFLFVNFPVLKLSFYNPVLTDTTAFALSSWLAYCFLKRNSVGILLSCVMGAFTWPTFFYSGILLYLFPNANVGVQRPPAPARHNLNTVVAVAVCALVLAAIVYTHYVRHMLLGHGNDQVNDSVILISILVVLAYTFTSLRHLLDLDGLFNLRAISSILGASRLTVAAALFISIKTIVAVRKGAGGYATTELLAAAVLESVAKPAIFLIAHVVYFGPVALFFMYYFRRLSGIVHRHGVGLTLYFVLYLLLALASESRYLIVAFPIAVMLVTMLMDTLPWKTYHGWMVCAICLLFSKIWLPINTHGLTGSYLAFPFQFYFMNQGPWMSMLSYAIQGVFIILTGSLLYVVFFRRVSVSNENVLPNLSG